MKGGITKKIEETVAALEKGQLKKALLTTDRKGLETHHRIVQQAAQICLENKGDKEACNMAIEDAKSQVQDTITLDIDSTSLEGVEELLSPGPQPASEPSSDKTEDELFEDCEECHVAVAAARVAEICAERPEEAGNACQLITEKLQDENTEPSDWIKTMVETAEKATGEAQVEMAAAVIELTDYLERRNSPFLKELDKS